MHHRSKDEPITSDALQTPGSKPPEKYRLADAGCETSIESYQRTSNPDTASTHKSAISSTCILSSPGHLGDHLHGRGNVSRRQRHSRSTLHPSNLAREKHLSAGRIGDLCMRQRHTYRALRAFSHAAQRTLGKRKIHKTPNTIPAITSRWSTKAYQKIPPRQKEVPTSKKQRQGKQRHPLELHRSQKLNHTA